MVARISHTEDFLSRFPSPDDVVRTALIAHVAGDWQQLASLLETKSLEDWRRDFVEANTHLRSADEWRAERPEAPAAALERLAEQMAAPIRAFVAQLSDHVAGVHSVDELARLSSTEVLIGVLRARDQTEQLNRIMVAAYTAAGIPHPVTPPQPRPNRRFEILRQERVSETRVHVSFREAEMGGDGTWAVTCDHSGNWRLIMSSNVLYLPGPEIAYIEDPIVIAYLDAQSSAQSRETRSNEH